MEAADVIYMKMADWRRKELSCSSILGSDVVVGICSHNIKTWVALPGSTALKYILLGATSACRFSRWLGHRAVGESFLSAHEVYPLHILLPGSRWVLPAFSFSGDESLMMTMASCEAFAIPPQVSMSSIWLPIRSSVFCTLTPWWLHHLAQMSTVNNFKLFPGRGTDIENLFWFRRFYGWTNNIKW